MLATNFTRNNEVSFSVNNQKQISNQQNKDQLMILTRGGNSKSGESQIGGSV